MLSLLLPLLCNGEKIESFVVYMSNDLDHGQIDPKPTKKRSGGQLIPCEITVDGIFIPSINTSEINLYEVLDLNGLPLVSFETEHAFLTYILTMKETVKIRFYLDGFVLSGFLYL